MPQATSPDLDSTFLASLVAHLPTGVLVTDQAGRVVLINQDAEHLLKPCLTVDEPLGHELVHLFTDCPSLTAVFNTMLSSTKSSQPMTQCELPGEDERYLGIAASKLGDYTIFVLEDLTEKVAADRLKTEFVSLVAHQLKTPVAEVKSYAENLLSGTAGQLLPKQREYLEAMRAVCDRNFRLIENLLDISQIEQGVMMLDLTPIELRLMVEEALSGFKEAIDKKGLGLELKGLDQEIVVFADPVKTIEVLRNLIHNALKFTAKGTITIQTSQTATKGIIRVSDTGSGIAPEQLKSLFHRGGLLGKLFMSGQGAGLGLYVAKQFLAFQKGTISVETTPGKGSTFIVKLPRFTATMPIGKKVKA